MVGGVLSSRGFLTPRRPIARPAGGRHSASGGLEPPGSPLVRYDFTNTSYLFQDQARTTAITAADQEIKGVTDIGSGGTRHLIDHASGDGMLYGSDGPGGFGGGVMSQASTRAMIYNPSGANDALDADQCMVYVGSGSDSLSGDGYVMTTEQTDGIYAYLNGVGYYVLFAGGGNPGGWTPLPGAGTDYAFIIKHNADGTTYFESSNKAATSSATEQSYSAHTKLALTFGVSRTGSKWGDGYMSEFLLYTGTPPALQDIRDYITDKYGIAWASQA